MFVIEGLIFEFSSFKKKKKKNAFYLVMLVIMSTSFLQKVRHMFVISNNTWHWSRILGKKGGRWAHTSWAGKEN